MTKLIEIPLDETILVSSIVENFDKPDTIYIPVSKNISLLKEKGDSVTIGLPLAKINNQNINSPISGIISGVKEITTNKGAKPSIEITNDFKEKTYKEPSSIRNLKNISKTEIDSIFKSFNINLNNKENLVLNAIDKEPYVVTKNFYLFLYYEGFLETLDNLAKIYNLKNIIIVLKSTSSDNITKLMSMLGMYPNITLKIVPDLYLIGEKEFLLSHLNINLENTSLIDSENFYYLYNLIKRNRNISDKLITISGNALKKPVVARVKIGTPLKFILKNLNYYNPNSYIVANGLMQGEIIEKENFIITREVDSILIMKEKKHHKKENCIKCGACINICPVGLNPLLLTNKEYYNKSIDKCLKCGLCSYICPTYINFNDIIKGDKHE